MNTLIGAAVAAIIAGLTATTAVLTGPDVTSLGDITGLQWSVLGIGVALSFFKDFQAISTRRLANKVTKTGDGGGSV